MKNVTIVATKHNEIGSVNATNLYRILDEISPEVIFLEVSPSDFQMVYNTNDPRTLEPKAVMPFARTHDMRLIPVDLPRDSIEGYRKADYILSTLERHSSDYGNVIRETIAERAHKDGFRYLNSPHYCKDKEAQDREDNQTVQRLNDGKASDLYEWWLNTNRKRERAMIGNILNYSQKNVFNRAVFLVGAAHLNSMLEVVRGLETTSIEFTPWNSSNSTGNT